MKKIMNGMAVALAVCSAVFALPAQAQAPNFPSKPVNIIVPTAPGGGSDTVARILAGRLSVELGQPVIVQNKPGASGNLAAAQTLQEPADGYNLVLANGGLLTVNAHLYANMAFQPARDFAPVIWAVSYSNLLVARNDLPANNVRELIAYSRKMAPEVLKYGTPGAGTSPHMAMEDFRLRAGIEVLHVPYKGMAPALTDLLGGRTDIAFVDTMTVLAHVKAGKLKPLGVSSLQRTALLPEVPTIAESGLKDFDVRGWNGLVVKAGTPHDRIMVLNAALNRALQSPEVIKALKENGADLVGGTPEKFGALIKAEDIRWGEVVKRSNIEKM